jgi:hypothetical protein
MIQELWTVAWKIWLSRNSILHDQKDNPLDDIDAIDTHIREEWNVGQDTQKKTENLFITALTTTLERTHM